MNHRGTQIFVYSNHSAIDSPTPIIVEAPNAGLLSLYHEIFEQFASAYNIEGAFWESENSDNLFLCVPPESYCQIEKDAMIMPRFREPVVRVSLCSENVPPALKKVMEKWYIQSRKNGDHGPCVLGAGISCRFEGTKYFIAACSPWQGATSWEHGLNKIINQLRAIGATDISYDPGRAD